MGNPDIVYVVGAGFSAGLGYPLTKSLLIDVWDQLEKPSRNQLQKIIKFHHPAFDWKRKTSFPNIEQLLTEIHVNLSLFDSSRPAEGGFTKIQLEKAREELLFTIAEWFHDLYGQARKFSWLEPFVKRLKDEDAAVLSFNWDLILDHMLFPQGISSEGYGLSNNNSSGPLLLKPHGSLNWYEGNQINKVKDEKRITIFGKENEDDSIGAFRFPRAIKSKVGKRYTPLIIPPTYLKDFARPLFSRLWEKSTEILSTAKKLVFLGYSLPTADLHAQFIFRCGFHNQIEGRLKKGGTRHKATGSAHVIIINPDQEAARRIEGVAGPKVPCNWVPKRIEEWVIEN
ncbi:MAG: hypothetical protein NPIRA03_40910 [Nitrospirales bacterium]|nr:MAG: hypothetical protein NPIRA03_40910 [Nitrospirales bacterium]